ncbi:MAG: AmmeMemoRadiSam system protein B [Gammaproteobacteria bacterium]|nr:AmmeMemoRadiSam system protein B [Gammaproteobacteria bacterium]
MRPTQTKTSVRQPAVAGFFYPDDPLQLRETVSSLLAHAKTMPLGEHRIMAFIVPHAGYIYSGPVAAVAYRTLAQISRVRRIVLIGPSHRVYFRGIALPTATAFRTPLGDVTIDEELRQRIAASQGVVVSDDAHRHEHSLEVQLPFLQAIFDSFTLLPLVAGDATASDVAAVLAATDDEDTVLLVSSDLSHYLPYERAQQIDALTSEAILRREPTLTPQQACGAVPINGLLHLARLRDARVEELARCNSGDTAGDRQRVVGYGAYAVYEA